MLGVCLWSGEAKLGFVFSSDSLTRESFSPFHLKWLFPCDDILHRLGSINAC